MGCRGQLPRSNYCWGDDDDVCYVPPHYHIRPPYSGRNNTIEWTNAMSRLELDTCYMGSYNGDIIHSNGRGSYGASPLLGHTISDFDTSVSIAQVSIVSSYVKSVPV